MRVERAVHKRLASAHALAFLHVDVNATGYGVFALRAVVADHVDLALPLGHFAELDAAIDLADDGGFARLAGFEQFDHARQTARDVLGLGGLARVLCKDVARVNLVSVLHHEVSAAWHEVTLVGLAALHDDCRLTFFVRRIHHDETREAGDFVHFFVEGRAFVQVLEGYGAADFGQDREGVRIPLNQDLAKLNRSSFFHLDAGAINHLVAFLFATLLVDDHDGTVAVHHDQIARLGADGLQVDEANDTVVLGIEARLLADSRCGTTDVEGTHGELRARFADGLGSDDTDCFAQLDQASRSQVAAVAHDANATLRFAGEHGADLDPLDSGGLNLAGEIFGDLLVDIDDDVAFVVLDLLERYAANDTVAERLDDVAGLDDGTDVDAVNGSAIVLGDDDILSYVDQATGEVAGVGRLESRIRQTLTSAVRRDEVLQHRETFTEVRRDGRFDDFAGRLSHQSAHTGELTNLLLGSSSAGVGHDVDGVDVTLFVMTLHGAEHLVGHLFSNGRPDFDDLVVALAIG